MRRLNERNHLADTNALTVTPRALDDFFDRFEAPAPDEDAISTDELNGALAVR
ncbi:hypothetical protein [Streptomyces montanisoli]|uniref:Uncharacterized protein n=1 Tax=Streptomyces montanisoli TaxID=2798581 RepID=A0A940MI96_9ACTN|nr:hypothetical protein [Streptomyces montanisoli]MBP0460167.1 hypothetical protein [Streptomyces montanisoli]